MNWRWLVPLWGIKAAIQDDCDNCCNDYMGKRLPLVLLYQAFAMLAPVMILATILACNLTP